MKKFDDVILELYSKYSLLTERPLNPLSDKTYDPNVTYTVISPDFYPEARALYQGLQRSSPTDPDTTLAFGKLIDYAYNNKGILDIKRAAYQTKQPTVVIPKLYNILLQPKIANRIDYAQKTKPPSASTLGPRPGANPKNLNQKTPNAKPQGSVINTLDKGAAEIINTLHSGQPTIKA